MVAIAVMFVVVVVAVVVSAATVLQKAFNCCYSSTKGFHGSLQPVTAAQRIQAQVLSETP